MTKWSDDEYEILHRLYPVGCRAVQALLPHRSIGTIKVIAHRHGVQSARAKARRRWTAEEDAIIRANFPLLGSKRTARLLLTGRTPDQVCRRAWNLGVAYRTWTAEEDGKIRLHYRTFGPDLTAGLLVARTTRQVRARAGVIGTTTPKLRVVEPERLAA
ncbi:MULTISPECIES: hypothetical protein [unclassified Bradyrhizobium]|uniref:hypothetical protein n=1 Tax=unclassified Bradyrhizobium TaxID=2631580 RepID=UPI002FEEBE1F